MHKPNYLSPLAKFILDTVPLVILFLTYSNHKFLANFINDQWHIEFFIKDGQTMFFALCFFIPTYIMTTLITFLITKKITYLQLSVLILVIVMSGLTIILKNRYFFFIKPTIIYGLFASFLLLERYSKLKIITSLIEKNFTLPTKIMNNLLLKSSIFFFALALSNEILWRTLVANCDFTNLTAQCSGELIWIKIKIFGYSVAVFAFIIFQMIKLFPYIKDNK